MTTNGMTHDAFNDRLMAFLEGDLDDTTRDAMTRHAESCAECGALLADLRDIRAQASKLPELTPSRDLWSGIAERIEAPVVSIGTATPATAFAAASRPALRSRWIRNTAWAASLVAAVSLGYFSAARDGIVAQGDTFPVDSALIAAGTDTLDVTTDARNVSATVPGAVSAQLAVATLNADYDREISRLRGLVDQRRNQMDPATVAVIEKNLTVIDAAIADSKKAIAKDPASRFLIEALNASLESKVELLRIAAALPPRSGDN